VRKLLSQVLTWQVGTLFITVFLQQFNSGLFSGETTDRSDERKKKEVRSVRRRTRAAKELGDLVKDNTGRSAADKIAIWRKIEQALANNDEVVNE